ncbi:uncharacterized protein LOC134089716 [Sardina pilchardus]|uniref:uncharacterized protein LOC134089716 n=1 Tax=Sardina pilchardus TaxID=27697 RepID=UPI002E14C7A3
MSDGRACQLCQATTLDSASDTEQIDEVQAVTRLDRLMSSGEVETFACDLAYKLVHLLKTNTCQGLSLPTDLGPPLLCGENDETDKSVSLKDPYTFVEESVKCFLHQLLFPSCPSKAVGPEDFIQGTPSSSGCMAKTAYESCSGDSTCSSQTLSETVDLLRNRVVNQVMEAVSSVADGENQVVKTTRSSTAESIQAVGVSSEYGANRSVKDVACSTSSLGLIIGLHTDSANRLGEPKSKVKTEVKICIKPKIKTLRVNKKYISKTNVVGPVKFEANASARKLQGNDIRQGTAGQSSEAQTSTSQTEKGSEGKSKKRNIFARFFSSISKSVRKCYSVQKAPKWNFWKFLVGPDGQVVKFWKAEEPFDQIRQEVAAQVRQIILKKRQELLQVLQLLNHALTLAWCAHEGPLLCKLSEE